MSTKKCWEPKQSRKHNDRTYFVNIESGVSQWGRQDIEDILPAGWEYCISKSGNMFYYNMRYKRAQWEKPTKKDKLKVPEGFEEIRSTNCKNVYYMNYETGKTQWTYPEEKETRGSEDIYQENRIDERQKPLRQKVNRTIQKRTPTRNNVKKVMKLREKVKKLNRLIVLFNDERSKDTEEFIDLSTEIQTLRKEINALKNELDKKEEEMFKDLDDERRNFQRDLDDKKEEEKLSEEMFKDLDDERRNFQRDLDDDLNYESDTQTEQSYEETLNHPRYPYYTDEFVDNFSTIPFSPNDGVSADFEDTPLSSDEDSAKRGKEIQNIISRIPTSISPPSELDEDEDSFKDALTESDEDLNEFEDFPDIITPKTIEERNKTFGEYSEYKGGSVPDPTTLSKRNNLCSTRLKIQQQLHPYRF